MWNEKMISPWAKDKRSDNSGKSHDGGDVDVQNCGLLLYQYLGLMIMIILLNDYYHIIIFMFSIILCLYINT